MGNRINVRVDNFTSGINNFTLWLRDFPEGLSDEDIKSKIRDMRNNVGNEWEIERNIELPYDTGMGVYNWENC